MGGTGNFRYAALADEIQENIMNGRFRAGEKLPSLRKLHKQLGLSVSTIHQAYIELEKRGRVEAREKSGFFVRALAKNPLPSPASQPEKSRPSRVNINALAETILADLQAGDMMQLGAAVASPELMPVKQLARMIKSLSMEELQGTLATYDLCQGSPELRSALAKQMLGHASQILPEDIVTTNGCLDAVSLCLRAVADPGDTILVESPVFHCFLQLIEDLNLYVLEMPTCPQHGLSPGRFEETVKENNVRACLFNTNFQNPLGSVIPRQHKQQILAVADHHDIPIIEDDIYGDLYFGAHRPSTFKSMDTRGRVLYCGSFSKTLAPGLRTGWAVPGRFLDKVLRLKLNTHLACPSINHRAAARFLDSGAYDRHLRRLRNQLKNQCSAMALTVSAHFPSDTRITYPRGGMFIWVELHPQVDTMALFHKAREHRISILPGRLCATSDRYKHCFRLNCGIQWHPKREQAIALLGILTSELYREKGLPVA